jgi:DMSO/TMAO reductase YedYZ molybdopterin-dependent catalytic subunit
MNRKILLAIVLIAIAALAITVFNAKTSAQAQTSSSAWQFSITGLVQNPMTLTLNDIKAMPQTSEYATLYCVDMSTVALAEGTWTGVSLSYLLQQANVSSSAIKVAFLASDGFATDLAVSTAINRTDIIVAYQLNNQSLGSFRLVVPNCWGYKWISSLNQIELVNYNFLGTEERAGYPDDGTSPVTAGQAVIPFPSAGPTPNTTTTNPTNTQQPPTIPPTTASTPDSTAPAAASNPNPNESMLLTYAITGSVIGAALAVSSAAILMKRKKARTVEQALKDPQVSEK